MRAHKGQKSIGIFFPHLVADSTFSLTWFQISKSKVPSSGNQGLCSITVWRQASIHWHETKSPWTLNKWWSKVEKWWGFPAVCPITLHLPDLNRSQSLFPEYREFQVLVWAPLVVFFTDRGLVDRSWWKERGKRRERESSISRVTWKTNKAHAQDSYRSWRHRVSSQGGLESPGKRVTSAGFHTPEN